jgi:hypothetical protein
MRATPTRSRRLIASLLVSAALSRDAHAAGELLQNGLFTEGAGSEPKAWTHEGYDGKASSFSWQVDQEGIGTVTIDSSGPNDARWVQNVPVSPSTWYRIAGWARAENVGAEKIGAYLSVMDTFHNSRDLRGTTGWQPLQLWVKTGAIDTSLRIACRLGGYSALNTGKAQFTAVSVEQAGTPAAGQAHVYGGTASESSSGRALWVQIVAVMVALGIALLLWRYLAPPSARIPP